MSPLSLKEKSLSLNRIFLSCKVAVFLRVQYIFKAWVLKMMLMWDTCGSGQ